MGGGKKAEMENPTFYPTLFFFALAVCTLEHFFFPEAVVAHWVLLPGAFLGKLFFEKHVAE